MEKQNALVNVKRVCDTTDYSLQFVFVMGG